MVSAPVWRLYAPENELRYSAGAEVLQSPPKWTSELWQPHHNP